MIRLDAHARATRAELLKQLKAIDAPETEAARKARKQARRDRQKAIGKPAKGQRQPRVRDNAYLAFLRRQPCLRCGSTPCDAAHVRWAPPGSGWRYVGKGEKPDDARAVPMCRADHELQHSMSEARFWAEVLERDPVQTCAELYALFLSGSPSIQHGAKGGTERSDCEADTNTTTRKGL